MQNTITKMDAVLSLNPNAEITIVDNDEINWRNTDPITDTEIDAEVVRLQAEYDNAQYARDRAEAYPSIEDQADMQYWDAVNGTTTWQDAIAAVKDAHPKP